MVDNYGSGLQYLSQAMGADICPPGCNPHPTIKSIHLFVGCRDFDWQGVRRAEMFMQALQDMPRPITVQRLRLDLGGFCFLWNKELAHFAELLKEKFVATTFEFCGSDYHWEWDMRVVPKALGMKLQPSVINFRHHSDQDQVLGWFSSLYERAQNENERLGLDGQGNEIEVRDGKYYFETRQNFFLGKLTNAS